MRTYTRDGLIELGGKLRRFAEASAKAGREDARSALADAADLCADAAAQVGTWDARRLVRPDDGDEARFRSDAGRIMGQCQPVDFNREYADCCPFGEHGICPQCDLHVTDFMFGGKRSRCASAWAGFNRGGAPYPNGQGTVEGYRLRVRRRGVSSF